MRTTFLTSTAAIAVGNHALPTSAFTIAPSVITASKKYTSNILRVSNQKTSSTSTPSTTFNFFDTTYTPNFAQPSEIDATFDTPPQLQTILTSLSELKSGSDLRGTFLNHANSATTIVNISHAIKKFKDENGGVALTPFASYCFGAAFARWLLPSMSDDGDDALTICIGQDPRYHGERLADSFARGAESVDGRVKVVYTGITSTPSMYEFVRYVVFVYMLFDMRTLAPICYMQLQLAIYLFLK